MPLEADRRDGADEAEDGERRDDRAPGGGAVEQPRGELEQGDEEGGARQRVPALPQHHGAGRGVGDQHQRDAGGIVPGTDEQRARRARRGSRTTPCPGPPSAARAASPARRLRPRPRPPAARARGRTRDRRRRTGEQPCDAGRRRGQRRLGPPAPLVQPGAREQQQQRGAAPPSRRAPPLRSSRASSRSRGSRRCPPARRARRPSRARARRYVLDPQPFVALQLHLHRPPLVSS